MMTETAGRRGSYVAKLTTNLRQSRLPYQIPNPTVSKHIFASAPIPRRGREKTMKRAMSSVLFVLSSSVIAAAQVPAPDFDIYASLVNPNLMLVSLAAAGPPNATVVIAYTANNPYTTPAPLIEVSILMTVQTDPQGHFLMSLPVQGQGPLPDLWLAAVVVPAGGNASVTGITGLSGSFVYASFNAPYLAGTKASDHSYRVAGETVPGHTISVWKTTNPCPSLGDTFNPAGAATTYEGGTVTDAATGDYAWNGTITPPGCIVVCETLNDGSLQVISVKQAE
jgi:hypothetical protein